MTGRLGRQQRRGRMPQSGHDEPMPPPDGPTAEAFVAALHEKQSDDELRKIQRYFRSGEGEYGEGDVFLGVRMGDVFALAKALHRHAARRDRDPARRPVCTRCGPGRAASWPSRRPGSAPPTTVGAGSTTCTCAATTASTTGTSSTWRPATSSAPGWPTIPTRSTATCSTTSPAPTTCGGGARPSSPRTRSSSAATSTTPTASPRSCCTTTDDLIHKAVGGWVRQAGKADRPRLLAFLDAHAASMPRTMLRYASEHLDADQRAHYRSLTVAP